MRVKIAALIGAFVMGFGSVSPAFAASGTLALSPATGTFNRGCNFTLEIKVNTGGVQSDGTDVILFYDPTRFQAIKINNGTAYSEYPTADIDSQNGRINISGISLTTAFSGVGTFATIDFKVADDAPTGVSQIKFDFDPNDKTKTTDSNIVEKGAVVDVLNSVTNGSYTVGTGTCGQGGTTTDLVATDSGLPQGGVTDLTAVPTKTPVLADTGDINSTVVIGISGTILVLLGLLGLAIL